MIKEKDLMLLPNGMNAKINEEIKNAFENSKKINRHLNCTHKPIKTTGSTGGLLHPYKG